MIKRITYDIMHGNNSVKKEKEGEDMNLLYKSTRNSEKKVTASEAILQGLAEDGGLFVPEQIPTLDVTLEELKDMTYQETAYVVMKQFLTDFTEEELKHCIASAYDSKFDTEVIAPLVKVGDVYHLELFHGATIAFKDMALSILPHLMTTSAKKNHVTKEDRDLDSDFRRYGESCHGGICKRSGYEDYCILSEKRSQPGAGAADGDTER